MKRLASFSAALALAALPLLVVPAPAHAAAAVSCDQGDDSAFSFESYDADFFLDVDADGRSTLRTVETFVAVFPDIDQNQGMRRAIPLAYQGHPTDVSVESVTDGDGNPRPFEAEEDEDGDFLLVTSRADECVHGAQTYVFTYTQHNVVLYPDDSTGEEFYWDTNGTGFDQPFGAVTARVHVPTALAASIAGDASCYRGAEGSTTPCAADRSEDADGAVFTASERDLGPGENVTLDVPFRAGTFVPRDDSYFGSPLGLVQLVGVGGGLAAVIWAAVLRRTALADGRGRPTIIAEYAPPKGMDPFSAAVLLKRTGRAAAAAFLDLAVRRVIRIIETPGTGFFSRGPSYVLELVDPTGLEGPELSLARALFGHGLEPGTRYTMTGKDTTLSEKVRGIIQSATKATTTDGLRAKPRYGVSLLPTLLALLAGVASFVAGVTLLDSAIGGVAPFLLLGAPILAVFLVFGLAYRIPLTERGSELRDHLRGLELYIRLAEADRLRMLQSPTGAEKVDTEAGDVVKVYEKLLPYAVLFNLEKQWAGELGRYYVDQTPDYYSGSGAFNAAVFASSIGGLSSSAASSFSGSSSSSSSSGGGGGGSSGGGGGDGGGGGV